MMTQILKWPGSKRARVAQLAGYFGDDARPVYCEPFLGTASIYGFGISRGIVVLGDAAPRLIPTYRALRKDAGEVARALAALPATVGNAGSVALARGWVAPADDKRAGLYADPWKAYFYHHRTSLNAWVPVFGEVATPERAAAFIWHRMAGFNGLMRVGPGGDNTPAGDGVSLPGRQELIEFGAGLVGALLVETDFEATIGAAALLGAVDLMLDPPYSGDFSGYTTSGFGDSDRDRLAACSRRVVEGSGRVVVTESDHPEARRWLAAAGLYVREAQGRTSISRSGAQRGAKPELVARSWPW